MSFSMTIDSLLITLSIISVRKIFTAMVPLLKEKFAMFYKLHVTADFMHNMFFWKPKQNGEDQRAFQEHSSWKNKKKIG